MSQSGEIPELPPFLVEMGFELREKVGDGGFSKVYRAKWSQRPNEDIAAKIISLADVQQEWVLKNLKNEMKISKTLKHCNIVEVYLLRKTQRFAYIFMEFARNGSVMDMLYKTTKPLTEEKAKKYFKDIDSAVAYCHKLRIAHRDIKPDNFLIDDRDRAKLSDFGFACTNAVGGERIMRGTSCGTNEFMAIELKVLKAGEVYDAKASDLYSLGVSLYVMVYFDLPFDPRKPKCIDKQKNKEFRHLTKYKTSDAFKDLIDKLLEPDPKKRITSEQVLSHKWLIS